MTYRVHRDREAGKRVRMNYLHWKDRDMHRAYVELHRHLHETKVHAIDMLGLPKESSRIALVECHAMMLMHAVPVPISWAGRLGSARKTHVTV